MCEEGWGSRGLPVERFYMTTPFRPLENAPFLEMCHKGKQRIVTNGSLFKF